MTQPCLSTNVHVQQIRQLHVQHIRHLLEASMQEGSRYMIQLANEFRTGENRFDKKGECLFVAIKNEKVIGICGLTRDPKLPQCDIGRIRKLYVLPEERRTGVGSMLVDAVRNYAAQHYRVLALFTDQQPAKKFYKRVGFKEFKKFASMSHYYLFD